MPKPKSSVCQNDSNKSFLKPPIMPAAQLEHVDVEGRDVIGRRLNFELDKGHQAALWIRVARKGGLEIDKLTETTKDSQSDIVPIFQFKEKCTSLDVKGVSLWSIVQNPLDGYYITFICSKRPKLTDYHSTKSNQLLLSNCYFVFV